MPKGDVSGEDPVPKMFWIMVGGNSLSSPPDWNRFLSMAEERNKVRRDAENEKREFQEASMRAKEDVQAAQRAYKEGFGGGFSAWKQRKREAENGAAGRDGRGRDDQGTERSDGGGE
ncbi:hypothetical protein CCHL11_08821 [Colletotrichum chlorophyti]|uniref:Uncharacterized protein n=1 Tax=Colletotrichum chlorophyti TaxID=708187 RepID=A0A1Q8RZB4_9PEZI|nr:hypothetical protein CCHL11_08821 [Colletotrichum chlorophyti]